MYRYEVTIGIPIYNAEKYVRRALDSALCQTHKNIEVLVYDDASIDSSVAIVKEFQQNHPRGKDIHLIRHSQNQGIGITRNRILEEAQGKYLFYLDADDEILPNTIERLCNEAKRINVELVYGSHLRLEEWRKDGKEYLFEYTNQTFSSSDEFAKFVYSKYDVIQVPVWNILMQVDFLKLINFHFPSVNFWEDFAATMFLPIYAKNVALISDITYIYHCRYGSLSHFQKRSNIQKREIQSVIEAMSELKMKCMDFEQKVYFPQIYNKVMMTHFYMADFILLHHEIITPAFTNNEICDIMNSPLSFGEVLKYREARWMNSLLVIMGLLPPSLLVSLMRLLAYSRRLIWVF